MHIAFTIVPQKKGGQLLEAGCRIADCSILYKIRPSAIKGSAMRFEVGTTIAFEYVGRTLFNNKFSSIVC
eukprot:scaffold21227_cov78-Skeletonema_dohrnii-CCMP3373.AAC.1